MRIVEILVQENGSHNNQTGDFPVVPNGYAVIPEYIKTPNFPFGDIEAEEIDGVMTVTKWVAKEIPKAEPMEKPISDIERLRADIEFLALMTEVDL